MKYLAGLILCIIFTPILSGQEKTSSNTETSTNQTATPDINGKKDLPKEITSLIANLTNDNPFTADEAREELLRIGQPAVPFLITALPGGNPELQYLVCEILAELRDHQAVAPLIHILQNEKGEYIEALAAVAARSLGYLADPAAVPSLMESLKSSDVELRYESIRTLGILRAKEAAPEIIKALNDNALTVFGRLVKCAAIEALGRLQNKEAVKELMPLIKDQTVEEAMDEDKKTVGEYVIKALEKITEHTEGSIHSADEKQKEEIIKKWEEWWNAHKTEYGAASIEKTPLIPPTTEEKSK
ncbi:MAG: HEAT repeat domain-containing protein [Planctomycetota bacterium]